MRPPKVLEFLIPCGTCEGEGEYDKPNIRGPEYDKTVRCEDCDGTGLVYSDVATVEQAKEGLRIAHQRKDARGEPVRKMFEDLVAFLKHGRSPA